MGWGPDHFFFYNDSYRPILGAIKHPAALGRPAVEVWPEIWDFIGTSFGSTMCFGRDISATDRLFVLDRNGYIEESYFDFSFSA